MSIQDGLGHVHMMVVGWCLDTECFRSWAPCDRLLKQLYPRIDSKRCAMFGDGQKGEIKSHKATFKELILRPCMRHREAELARDAKCNAYAPSLYRTLMRQRTVMDVKQRITEAETLVTDEKEKKKVDAAVAKIHKIPLDQQIPANLHEAGHAPSYGRYTANDAEVVWPMLEAQREEADPFEMFMGILGVMKHRSVCQIHVSHSVHVSHVARKT